MSKIELRRSKSSGDKTQKPDYSGLATNQKWVLGSWGSRSRQPFLIGNRSSNGGCSVVVITPQNIMFLKKSYTHTHTSSWCTKQHVFVAPFWDCYILGGLFVFVSQKNSHFSRMGVSICDPQFVGWTAEVIRKTELIFYILLVLQESWINPQKIDMIEKHEGKHFSWYFLTIFASSSATWFNLLFWYHHSCFQMLPAQKRRNCNFNKCRSRMSVKQITTLCCSMPICAPLSKVFDKDSIGSPNFFLYLWLFSVEVKVY